MFVLIVGIKQICHYVGNANHNIGGHMTKQLSDIDEKKMKEVFSKTPEDAIKRIVI